MHLYLLRHAEAQHPPGCADFDRPLSAAGILEAQALAATVAADDSLTGKRCILASTAARTQQTAAIFTKENHFPENSLQHIPEIYEASAIDLLKIINNQAEDIEHLIIIGHNPGLSYLIHYISGIAVTLKTAQLAHLSLEEGITFPLLSASTANLVRIIG